MRTVLAEPYHVPSPSMVPTLLVGDQLVATKYAYGYSRYSSPIDLMPDFSGRLLGKEPERGDVVVFRLPRDPATTYVKRLIGLPGDRIQMKGGRLYINDAIVPRRLIGPFTGDAGGRNTPTLYVETLPGGREHEIIEMSDADRYDDTPVFVVPPRHYFMMGDNRDNSVDSRIAIPTAESISFRKTTWSAAPSWCCCHAIRRSPGPTWRNGRTLSGQARLFGRIHWHGMTALGVLAPAERGPLRTPAGDPHRGDARASRARVPLQAPRARDGIFREHFAEPGLRPILVGDELSGCVGFRIGRPRSKSIPSILPAAITIAAWGRRS